jgi:hypothetical protein
VKLLTNYRKLIYDETAGVENFMYLLMKQRNKKGKWTQEDVGKIKNQIKLLSNSMPFLILFILPLGVLMLPLLAMLLDRRREIRCS